MLVGACQVTCPKYTYILGVNHPKYFFRRKESLRGLRAIMSSDCYIPIRRLNSKSSLSLRDEWKFLDSETDRVYKVYTLK
jgi:hypothetical protein